MKTNTKRIALMALFTAFAVTLLYVASVFPTGQIGFIAAASLFVMASVIESGPAAAICVYAASCILGLLIVPNKTAVFIFALFLGYYPVLKYAAEKCRSRVVEWIIKLAVLNVALTAVFFLLKVTFFDFSNITGGYVIAYAACNAAFVLYDIGIAYLARFYVNKISRRIRRN